MAAVLDRPMMQSDVVKIVHQRFPVRTGCRVPQSRFGIEGLMEAMPVPHSITSRPPGIGAAHGELDYTHDEVVLIPIVVVPVGCAHPLSMECADVAPAGGRLGCYKTLAEHRGPGLCQSSYQNREGVVLCSNYVQRRRPNRSSHVECEGPRL